MNDTTVNAERTPFVNDEDPRLLLIKGNMPKDQSKDYVKKLANAISKVISKHEIALLRCVGAAAVNNAVKSTIIASGEAVKHGINLVLVPSFHNVNFDGVGEKTSIVFEVKKI